MFVLFSVARLLEGKVWPPQHHQFVARGKVGVAGVEVLIGGSATTWGADLAGMDLTHHGPQNACLSELSNALF